MIYCHLLVFFAGHTPVLAYSLFSKMTMEVILATAFGRSVDVQGGQGGEVYQAAREMFSAIGEDSGKFIRMLQLTLCED
jgi:hypothetical protein